MKLLTWRQKKMKYNIANDLRGHTQDEIVDAILESRGIKDKKHFLNPKKNDMLPLGSMKYEKEAAEYLISLMKSKKTVNIIVYADTDLDGVSSAAIMTRYLRNYNCNVIPIINQGKAHGVKRAKMDLCTDADVVIVVDSINDSEREYKDLIENHNVGKIIVLDHHNINPDVPYDDYCYLISSQRDYENTGLSGAGVTWKFCMYLDSLLERNYADDLSDLAASGILADVMPIGEENKENRYIVYTGLNNLKNPFIKKLVGSFDFNSTAVLYSLAPAVNACVRTNHSEVALDAFLSDDNKELIAYNKMMKQYKEQQNLEVDSMMPMIEKQINDQKDNKMIVVNIDTDLGLSGLIGNKILGTQKKPVLVLNEKGDEYQGSMRSEGVGDFAAFVNDSNLAEALGHEEAAGIKIKKDKLNDFTKYVEEKLVINKNEKKINVDAQIDVEDINRNMIDAIKKIDFITGKGFPTCKFFISGIDDYTIGNMSQGKHLVIKPNDYIQIIKWNWTGDWDEIEDHSLCGDEVKVVCTLDSGWLGRTFVLKCIVEEMEIDG